MKKLLFSILIGFLLLSSCTQKKGEIVYSGLRSSRYGIRPFPEPENWGKAINQFAESIPESKPSAIWIVGTIRANVNCSLGFPKPDENKRTNISFTRDEDLNEKYLEYFDKAGIEVFLQVEPAYGNVEELIDLVLNQYKKHKSVVGFGVDVEWYKGYGTNGYGSKVDDETAKKWENKVKDHNKEYRLFLKHWDKDWMPPEYRGDIVFVSDSQIFESMDSMIDEFSEYWADHFYPNIVAFQYGYNADRKLWKDLDLPAADIANMISKRVRQKIYVYWVDFTLEEVFPIIHEK